MPLRSPILDDRSYAQLRDELIARIPVYAPEWTDHSPSDPGIALVELFAFLGENLLFRFNQIPDATKLAFLRLLDVPLRPATPAAGIVACMTAEPAGVLVPADTRLLAGPVEFRSVHEVHAWPVTARAAIRAVHAGTLDEDTAELLARARVAVGATSGAARPYRTTFGAARPERPGGDVLDPATAVDGRLFVLLTADPKTPPDPARFTGGALTVGVVPAAAVAAMADVDACPGVGTGPAPPEVRWQICTTTPVPGAPDPDTADPVWLDLAVVADTSAGLTRPGAMTLRMPADLSVIGGYLPADPDAVGAGDQPPLLEDDALAGTLLAWLRAFRPGGSPIGALEWVGVNATDVEQAAAARAEFLGTGTGEPGQEYPLVHSDVLGTVELDVEEQGAGRFVPWTHVELLDAAGVDDRVFTVDREAGTVRFGDGRRGRCPQIGERIRVRRYRYGGGVDGNVGAGAITVVRDVLGVTAVNPLPCRGGAAAEGLADALDRIPGEFRRHDRAVTASDFAELAEATPGAGVVRAETLPQFHPRRPTEATPGAVSVVVWPATDALHPDAPRPDRDTLRAVCRWLDERRLATTELYVIPPTYRRVAVTVGIAVKPGYGVEGVRRWVELVLRQYLAPVPPSGPEGRGWPLGRAVFGPELEAAALQVEGLEFLEGLRVAQESDAGGWTEPPGGRVALAAWEVPELAALSVVTGPPGVPGQIPPPPPVSGPPVPVRAPREVCR